MHNQVLDRSTHFHFTRGSALRKFVLFESFVAMFAATVSIRVRFLRGIACTAG